MGSLAAAFYSSTWQNKSKNYATVLGFGKSMHDETVHEHKSNLLELLSQALELADGLAELDVAIRISEAIDILQITE